MELVNNTRIETIFELPNDIPCKKEVLGMEFQIEIGSHKGILAFPNIPRDFKKRLSNDGITDNKLICPTNSEIQIPHNENVHWGYFFDSNGNASVKKCSIWFPCNLDEYNEIGSKLSKITSKYIDKFILFLEILSKNTFDNKAGLNIDVEHLTGYWLFDKTGSMINAHNNEINISVTFHSDEFCISKNLIEKALYFSNMGFEPSLQYKLFRDSIFHKNNDDFRRAIIDASTAIEIVLTERIKEEYIKRKINDTNFIKSKLEKHHSLSGRIELITMLNINLPRPKSDYKETLSRIRNKSIHAGYKPSLNEVKTVIEIANDTLQFYCKEVYD
ncbi:MAG: hypothetical protein A2046_01510 [Bacteroidetes bacterium GWA2_30_7]|nr:MAG: hypothetical protein A2046_01510 [Bacteroidetes bacterium GWA2_30_7]